MKIFLIHADENQNSFSSIMGKRVVRASIQYKHAIVSSDLYEMKFIAVPSKNDFTALKNTENYEYQKEQENAALKGLFSEDIQNEMDKIERSDLLIFTFPLKWFSMPSILKGWIDRVLAFGYSYGGSQGTQEKGKFVGKKVMLAISANDPTEMYSQEAQSQYLKQGLDLINHQIFAYNGFSIIDPYVIHQSIEMNDQTKEDELNKFEKHLVEIAFESAKSVATDNDHLESKFF